MTGDPTDSAATEPTAEPAPPVELAAVPPVRQALDDLARVDELPVHEHPAVYERVHERLEAAMTDPDEA